MSLLAAARLNDPIAHSSMFAMIAMIGKIGAGLLVGMVVGAPEFDTKCAKCLISLETA